MFLLATPYLSILEQDVRMAIKESVLANGATLHVIPTNLKYWLDLAKGGTKDFYPGTAGAYRRKHEPHQVDITDVRGHEKEFKLDKQGFEFVQREPRSSPTKRASKTVSFQK